MTEERAPLEQEILQLREQVKTLVSAEAKLHRAQRDLDHQLNIFNKLHELGVRISTGFDLQAIGQKVAAFALYELGYERCIVLLENPVGSGYRVLAHDGYYSEKLQQQLAELRLAPDHALLTEVASKKRLVWSGEAAQTNELAAIAGVLGLGELLAFPMFDAERLQGALIAGNSSEQRQHFVAVSNTHSATGFANLSAQASAVIASAINHHAVAKHQALQTEVELAREVQQSILPEHVDYKHGGLSLSGFLVSATGCSGDFWTYQALADGRLMVVMADVNGHGIASAMVTEFCSGALDALVRTSPSVEPEQIVAALDAALWRRSSLWMTMLIGIFSADQRSVTWTNAGHTSLLAQIGDAPPRFIPMPSDPIGAGPESTRKTVKMTLEQPARFLLYSDGLIEARNAGDRQFGARNLLASFQNADADPALCLSKIRTRFEEFTAGVAPEDDVTAVCIRTA